MGVSQHLLCGGRKDRNQEAQDTNLILLPHHPPPDQSLLPQPLSTLSLLTNEAAAAAYLAWPCTAWG